MEDVYRVYRVYSITQKPEHVFGNRLFGRPECFLAVGIVGLTILDCDLESAYMWTPKKNLYSPRTPTTQNTLHPTP